MNTENFGHSSEARDRSWYGKWATEKQISISAATADVTSSILLADKPTPISPSDILEFTSATSQRVGGLLHLDSGVVKISLPIEDVRQMIRDGTIGRSA